MRAEDRCEVASLREPVLDNPRMAAVGCTAVKRMNRVVVSVGPAAVLAVGCAQLAGYDGYSFHRGEDDAGAQGTGGVSGTGGESDGAAGETGGTGGSVGPCSACGLLEACHAGQRCVAKSVPMPKGYSIDATEVTIAQYEAWLATAPSTSGQPPFCKNQSYEPDADCMASSFVCQGGGCGNHPQACVDWCDAYAYCAAIGKRLCGKIGGGMNDFDSYASASRSQWHAACSSGGQYAYPYGNAFDSATCNGKENPTTGCASGSCMTTSAGSLANCQSTVSGYEGVYDLSGNLWEWEDSCDQSVGSNDLCRIRGGSFYHGETDLRCDANAANYRGSSGANVGFRCCSSP